MHHIYHTEGIILGSRGYGEAGKYYDIFTKDLGMLRASAQGVRKMSSKLRYVLQDFTHVRVDLIQGKDFWRITTASKTGALEELSKKKENFRIFVNITRLLRRLLAGTEPNEPLFIELMHHLSNLEKASSRAEIEDVEITLVLSILEKLGYVDALEAAQSRAQTVKLINNILRETHL